MKKWGIFILAICLLLGGCSTLENSGAPSSPADPSEAAHVSSTASSKPEENPGEELPEPDFDFTKTQDRYLFFTQNDPENPFEIAEGDTFSGWTAETVSYAGSDPDEVNLRASFSGSITLTGEIVILEDRLGGSENAYFIPDEEAEKSIPLFFNRGRENDYILVIEGISAAEIRALKGEPSTRERTVEGETVTDLYYPGCTITATQFDCAIGDDENGAPAMGYVHRLTVGSIS